MDSRAVILHIIKNSSRYADNDLGKKKIQKLVYLVERFAPLNLGYEYEIYFYGPYSKTLDDDLRALSRDGLIRYDKQGRSYLVSITTEGDNVLQDLASQSDFGTQAHIELQCIDDVLAQYAERPPFELELLTTANFVWELLGNEATQELIELNVERIKGRKFKKAEIHAAVDELMTRTS